MDWQSIRICSFGKLILIGVRSCRCIIRHHMLPLSLMHASVTSTVEGFTSFWKNVRLCATAIFSSVCILFSGNRISLCQTSQRRLSGWECPWIMTTSSAFWPTWFIEGTSGVTYRTPRGPWCCPRATRFLLLLSLRLRTEFVNTSTCTIHSGEIKCILIAYLIRCGYVTCRAYLY
jgi:hypothetical protein